MKIFCHVDHDGRACGAILHRRFPNADVHFYNYWYPIEKIVSLINPNENIIFGDITPNNNVLLEILKLTNNITILDHHTSVIDNLKEIDFKVNGDVIISTENIGACVTVWRYCYPKYNVPNSIKMIGEYDVWLRNDTNKVFHYGLDTFNTHPKNKIWDRLLRDHQPTIKAIMRTGNSVYRYVNNHYKKLLNSYAMEGIVPIDLTEGAIYNAILINQGGVDGAIFDNLEKKYDIYFRVVFNKNWRWNVSAATDRDDIDLTKIATKFSGGGRSNIVGFTVDDISDIFEWPEES